MSTRPPTLDLVAGDIADTAVLRVDGVTDLLWVTSCAAHIWQLNGTPTTLTATVTDAAAREVTVNFGSGGGWLASQTADGEWLLELQLVGGGQTLTWPRARNQLVQVTVRTQGA